MSVEGRHYERGNSIVCAYCRDTPQACHTSNCPKQWLISVASEADRYGVRGIRSTSKDDFIFSKLFKPQPKSFGRLTIFIQRLAAIKNNHDKAEMSLRVRSAFLASLSD